jgi:geranyl-CoA carboxylase alpha subunit
MHKILIANRGEIAVRVIATARNLGYRTVAVYSDADAGALHVAQADEAIHIGPSSVGESYLLPEKILAAAKKSGADAIHPGYGFLSENGAFARLCEAPGLTFIGPPPAAIELMGSKRLSKIAMLEAGVPCIPGYQGAQQDDETLIEKAADVGFPLMVKASAGGGGRGMRLVWEQAELASQIKTARSEAQSAFGSGELILERAVLEPRHIEIQVFADAHGNCVYLGERDCSIQRRHQKVVEEAPSPFVDEALRQRMGAAAVNAALSCDYRGAGTVEFLVDADKNFYFLEMNTRLQVEHPVTELVTGLDLVEWQLAVAEGEKLPLTQSEISLKGHAVEVRLYAEDPRDNFMPQTGPVLLWDIPTRDGIRIDHGIQQGQQVSSHYDPLLAKVISYGHDRKTAIRKLASAVEDTKLLGLNNNRQFLQNILRHSVFIEGGATTAFMQQHFSDDPSMAAPQTSLNTLARAALVFYQANNYTGGQWRRSTALTHHFKIAHDSKLNDVYLSVSDNVYSVRVGDNQCELELLQLEANYAVVVQDEVRNRFAFAHDKDAICIDDGQGHFVFNDMTHQPEVAVGGGGNGQVKASMDGAIVEVLVAQGDQVEAGQLVVVLEAMKMEHQLKAAISGTVDSISVSAGQQVKTRQLLVNITGQGAQE